MRSKIENHDTGVELNRAKLPTLDDVFEDRASLGAYVRARPVRVTAIAGGITAFLGGVVTLISLGVKEQELARAEFKKNLQSATGVIAYAHGTRIEVITLGQLLERTAPRAFQVGGVPHQVSWLSDHEIIFARQHPQGSVCSVKGSKETYTGYAASSLIEVLDIETSTVRTLIDPYKPTEAFTTMFGECKEADANIAASIAKQEKEFFDPPKSGIRIWTDLGPHGKFLATGFGSEPTTKTPYVKVGDIWYAIVKRGDDYQIESSVYVPTNSAQGSSPCGRFYLEEPNTIGAGTGLDWLEIRQNSDRRPSFELAKGASCGAWRP